MRKILYLHLLILLSLLMASCTKDISNNSNIQINNKVNNDILVNDNDIYCYYKGDNIGNKALYKIDVDTKNRVKIFEDIYSAILGQDKGRLYYAKSSNLNFYQVFSISLDDSKGEYICEGEVIADITKNINSPNTGGNEFRVENIGGILYLIADKNIYSINDGEIIKKYEGIVSLFSDRNTLYISDEKCNIYKYDLLNKQKELILQKDRLIDSIDKVSQIFGNDIIIKNITKYDNYLYFIVSAGSVPSGGYVCRYKEGSVPECVMNFKGSTSSYNIYKDKLYFINSVTGSVEYIDIYGDITHTHSLDLDKVFSFYINNNKIYYVQQNKDFSTKKFVVDIDGNNKNEI